MSDSCVYQTNFQILATKYKMNTNKIIFLVKKMELVSIVRNQYHQNEDSIDISPLFVLLGSLVFSYFSMNFSRRKLN